MAPQLPDRIYVEPSSCDEIFIGYLKPDQAEMLIEYLRCDVAADIEKPANDEAKQDRSTH